MFGQMKEMYKLQSQMKKVKKELAQLEIEAEEGGVVVVVNGSQEVVSIEYDEDVLNAENKTKLEKDTVTALARAMKKSQEIAAEKMKPMMGGMGLPGM